jgi:glycosyltransferase involved in cell wall biosynthesis
MAKTVAVCAVQVPFVYGGAELLVSGLVAQLRARGVRAELVTMPFRSDPREEILRGALLWKLLGLADEMNRELDLVIATKFPSYLIEHPRKVAWLIHQYREVYDLYDTRYCGLSFPARDQLLREEVLALDRQGLGSAAARYAISRVVSDRLREYTGIEATPVYHPPPLAGRYRSSEYGDFLLSVGRLSPTKRHELLIETAAALGGRRQVVIAGEGPEERHLRHLVEKHGLAGRVHFRGFVSDDELIELLASCRAVYNAPLDEDYGYVTLEAFLSRKPVVTATDSGGVLEFVVDGENGLVAAPEAGSLATAVERLFADPALARRLGEAGHERARAISWDGVIERLLAPIGGP